MIPRDLLSPPPQHWGHTHAITPSFPCGCWGSNLALQVCSASTFLSELSPELKCYTHEYKVYHGCDRFTNQIIWTKEMVHQLKAMATFTEDHSVPRAHLAAHNQL